MPKVEGAPDALNNLLDTVYTECMKDGDEEKCSRIAWGAAENAGWTKQGEQWVKAQDLKGVELLYEGEFRPSNWNGKPWSVSGKMIDDIVANTERYMSEANEIPYIKLSHDSEVDESAKKFLGEMALGKVSRIYTEMRDKGKTLIADFTAVPDKMMKLIREGLASKRSVEIRTRPQYGPMLDAVAFFGAGSPAVKGLNDLANSLAMSEAQDPSDSGIAVLCYDFEECSNSVEDSKEKEENEMDEAKLKEMQDKIDSLTLENETLKTKSVELAEYESKMDSLKVELEAKEVELTEFRARETESKKAGRAAYIESLVNEGKIIPAMKDELVTFCTEASDETFDKLSGILAKMPESKLFEEKIPSNTVHLTEGMSREDKIGAWCKANNKDPKDVKCYREACAALKLED